MDFEKVCTIFTMQEPYYGILLSAMDRFPTTKIDTMGVCRSGNVFRLGYNPDYVADKDLPTLMCMLKHECIHIAFNVFTMFDTEPSCPAEHQLRNMYWQLYPHHNIHIPDILCSDTPQGSRPSYTFFRS